MSVAAALPLTATMIIPLFDAKLSELLSLWPVTLVCLLLPLASVAMPVSLRRRLYLSDRGLESRSPLGRETFIAWSDIERVRFYKWSGALRVHGRENATVVIPSTMCGIKDLEDIMVKRLPPEIFTTAFMKYRAALKAFVNAT